ncbi:ABC transporter ATP-binding protein [Gordonia soli]|uniref:Putative iron-siderophore ABC transporter permease/ATP-binding protein n=1 Tax=Gordonia soli NBRC 108243 TaxID=1223545 RepID=M0QER2_9ACTN|nr:ABC transporter ATP-binding protein [Gordonia soli]GAC66924.1 putative iron-siderophore ABC transporter permease/ATP-binding protein [Gordonia soli NBRC 108243]
MTATAEPDIAEGAITQTGAPPVGLASAGALGRLFAPIRGHLVACAVLSAASAAGGLLPYVAIAEISRVLLESGSRASDDRIWAWVGVGAAGAVAWLLLLVQSSRIGHFADAEILHSLRVRIVRHLGSVPLGWFAGVGSGRVKRALTNDLEEMHEVIAHALGQLTGAVTVMVVGIGYLAFVDLRMAGVVVVILGLTGLFYRIAMRSMTTHVNRLIAAEVRISAASVEYADGIEVVKTYGAGGRVLRRFDDAVREFAQAFAVWTDEVKHSSAASRLFGSEMAILVAVTAVGLALLDAGSLTVADLIAFLVVAIGLPNSILPAVNAAQGVRKGRMGAANVEHLLAIPALPEPRHPELPRGHDVEFDRVSFSYDRRREVLTDVRASCRAGRVTAIVGPSGAGKSTLAGLLPRFHDVTGGAIRIGGVDVRAIGSEQLLGSMSLVFQDVTLVRDTVTENIRIGRPDADLAAVRAAARTAHVDDVIRRLPQGYDTRLDASGGSLSGGERQRLTIARAILSEAPIVVLDEATSALDPDSETAVQEALASLATGKTVIVIAHRLHTIVDADQILVLDGGRLVESGRHADLVVAGGLYSRMWAAQGEAIA